VVVPTFKREEMLHCCLRALHAQTLPAEDFEIVVSDNAGSTRTRQLVDQWKSRRGPVVRYLQACGTPGPAAARNAGWRAARAPLIAFTDDDCIPEPNWLASGLAAFDCGIAGAWGRIVVPIPRSAPTDYDVDTAKLERAEFVNANCFYTREALESVGGFDERFEVAWREDSDLFFRLLRSGRRFIQVPAAVVTHPPRPAFWGISLFQQKKNMFNALLYKKHPALYRERIQPAPPWRYYLSVGSLALALVGSAAGPASLGLAAVGFWAGLTGHFCATRLARTSHSPTHVLEMLVTSALIPPVAIFWRLWGAVRFRVWFF
jgi:glycosyltransferase involved in cell wall biosynthesis